MPLRLLAAVALALFLVSASSATAARRDYAAVALNVLPPGEAGLEGGPNATDQLQLYDGLTPLWNAIGPAALRKYFKPERFGLGGRKAARVEDVGRKGLRILRDRWDVAHITGKTRSDVFYGAGWVTAEDRNLLLQLIRGPARVAALDVPGIDAFSLALSGRSFVPSAQAEAFIGSQVDLLRSTGAGGRRIIADTDAFVAGLNAYFGKVGFDIPPWTRNDVVAAGALIAAVFGLGGGDEVRRAEFLDALEQRVADTTNEEFPEGRAFQIWDDLRNARVDSPVSVPGSFPYGQTSTNVPAGNVVVDDGSFEPISYPGTAALRRHRPMSMSNGLLVGAKRSATHHPIFVAGPQVGYYYPEFFLELDLHGGGIDTRGAVFPGLPWVVIGRGKDYAWSAQSSHSDIVDEFVETLCGGDDFHYLYKGECRPMETFDAGVLKGGSGQPDEHLVFRTTVHGPVVGYAKVDGTRVAIARERSTRGRELLSARAFADLDANKARSAKQFFTVMNQEEFSFNWVYADNRDIAFFSAGRLPQRAADVDIGLPTKGTGDYDWQGFERLAGHARGIDPPSGVIAAWNNRPANDYSAPDDQWAWGSVQRVQLLQQALAARKRHTVSSVVGAMNQAATQDLRAVVVWPAIKAVLERAPGPGPTEEKMVQLVDSWRSRGASRLDGDSDGKIDDPGAAIMDALWPKIAEAVMSPVLGTLTERLALLIPVDDPPNPQGSAFDSGWYSYVYKDLTASTPTYCGGGDPVGCTTSLWQAMEDAAAELTAAQGPDPTAWRADAAAERIHFAPGLMQQTMRWTNRPTFQQVISFKRHRPRR